MDNPLHEATAAERYAQLASDRQGFLDRARACATLTIPSLMPPEGHNANSPFLTPRQSLGARAVNNLASKLLLALLPPNAPFFKHTLSRAAMEDLGLEAAAKAKVEKALGEVEREIMNEIENRALRTSANEVLRQLIVSGNALLYIAPDGKQRVFRLDSYVVLRDASGNLLEIVVEEEIARAALPDEVRLFLQTDSKSNKDTVKLYTHVKRAEGKWEVYQEVDGVLVPDSEGTYPLDKLEWLPLRWTRVDGEDYGRTYVEEFYGDFQSLEGLMDSLLKGAAASARIVPLVAPNGQTDIDELNRAEDGDFVSGNIDDVGFLQVQKFADLRVAQESIRDLRQAISQAFLLNSSVQRNGERVTAEEIRFMAGELEDALGGVYSVLSLELQLPIVTVISAQLQKAGKLPALPKNDVKPQITTGLEALGRGHDLNKLDVFLSGLNQALGPEVTSRYLSVPDFITRRATALGLDTNGLVRSEEEVQKKMQQDKMQQMIQQLGPNIINQLGSQESSNDG